MTNRRLTPRRDGSMSGCTDTIRNGLLSQIRGGLASSSRRLNGILDGSHATAIPFSGKLLRSRLGIELYRGGISDLSEQDLINACVAVELVHTASLCHDDVIDGAPMRRHRPALWQVTSRSGAVLTGDILLCDAIDSVMTSGSPETVRSFLSKVREVCCAEAEQELSLRTKPVATQDCLRIARGKTGPLFAFISEVCAGSNQALAARLAAAGYAVGAAYQLVDDLVDLIGTEHSTGKTVRNDVQRQKHTLAQEWHDTPELLISHVEALTRDALAAVSEYPAAGAALHNYLQQVLQPIFEQLTADAGIQWRLTACN